MTGNTAISVPSLSSSVDTTIVKHRDRKHQPHKDSGLGHQRHGRCVRGWLTFHIFHDHAQVAPGLKGAVHADNERVFCKSQDIPFHKGLLDLVSEDEVLLINLLHGKPLPGFLMPNEIDCPEKEHKELGFKGRGEVSGYSKPCRWMWSPTFFKFTWQLGFSPH